MILRLSSGLALAILAANCTNAVAQVTVQFDRTSGFQNSGIVPDDTATGWADVANINSPGNNQITAITVSLQVSGGFTGDLYAQLTGPSGTLSVLLNRVGRTSGNPDGYANVGFNVTFDDGAAHDIHLYQNSAPGSSLGPLDPLTGTWQSDARDPILTTGLDTDTRSKYLNSFVGENPNGNWTLFVADLSTGGQSTVVSWGMQVTAVPEPAEYAAMTAAALSGFAIYRRARRNGSPVKAA